MGEVSQAFLDAVSVRALAHPLRSRILGRLRTDGPATSTMLAARLDTNSGVTSYHLRKLAEVGLVAEDAEVGDGRDRWWRAVHDVTSWSNAQFRDDPDARAAADWLLGFQLRSNTERTQAWVDTHGDWPTRWLEVADLSDYRLYLTADEAEALGQQLHEVILRFRQRGEDARDTGAALEDPAAPAEIEARVPVAMILHLHPDVRS